MSPLAKEAMANIFKAKIISDLAWTERAVLAIYSRQTEDEKQNEVTLKNNSVGFNGPDSKVMSYYAKWLLKGNHLSGRHLETARKKIVKYVHQLVDIAVDRAKEA